MTSEREKTIDDLVKRGASGLGARGMRFVLEHAAAAPDGPWLEVGTFRGETALALLELGAPYLVTVDPYGNKPYLGGDGVGLGLYDDDVYVDAKARLWSYANHAHFTMTGVEFLSRCVGSRYWRDGKPHSLTGFGFAFLDGQHDAATVLTELDLLVPAMAPGGRVVIDNVDKDPTLLRALTSSGVLITDDEPGARQALFVVKRRA